MTKKSITGTVKAFKSDKGAVCLTRLELPKFKQGFPTRHNADLEIWLKNMFNLKELDGRRIRVTAELL